MNITEARAQPGSPYTAAGYPDRQQRGDRRALGDHFHGQRRHRRGRRPNKLVAVTDRIAEHPAPPSWEQFATVRSAATGQALRGVSFTPTDDRRDR